MVAVVVPGIEYSRALHTPGRMSLSVAGSMKSDDSLDS